MSRVQIAPRSAQRLNSNFVFRCTPEPMSDIDCIRMAEQSVTPIRFEMNRFPIVQSFRTTVPILHGFLSARQILRDMESFYVE